MQSFMDGVRQARQSHALVDTLIAAIGSVWTFGKDKTTKTSIVRPVAWVGPAHVDSAFLLQLEQNKGRALYYHSRNQTR
jgi:hypothetical protein